MRIQHNRLSLRVFCQDVAAGTPGRFPTNLSCSVISYTSMHTSDSKYPLQSVL